MLVKQQGVQGELVNKLIPKHRRKYTLTHTHIKYPQTLSFALTFILNPARKKTQNPVKVNKQ